MQAFSTETYSMRLEFMALNAAAVSRRFMRLSVLCALSGLGMELAIGVKSDWTSLPAPVLISLFGWLSSGIISLIYRAVPRMAEDGLATLHLMLAATAIVTTMVAMLLRFYSADLSSVTVSVSVLTHMIAMLVLSMLIHRHF